MNTPSKEHARDLVQVRMFFREVMKEVGCEVVSKVLSTMARSTNTLLRDMYEEEYNVLNPYISLDKKFWVTIDDDVAMVATPKVHHNIVRVDNEDDDVVILDTPPPIFISAARRGGRGGRPNGRGRGVGGKVVRREGGRLSGGVRGGVVKKIIF